MGSGGRARRLLSALRWAGPGASVTVTSTDASRASVYRVWRAQAALRLRTRAEARGCALSCLCSWSLLPAGPLEFLGPWRSFSQLPFTRRFHGEDGVAPGDRWPRRLLGNVVRTRGATRSCGSRARQSRGSGGLFLHPAPSFAFPAPIGRPGVPRLPPASASTL